MIRAQEQAQKIRTLLDASNSFYQDLLSYKPEQTSLEQVPESKWNKFARTKGLNSNSSGIYLPRNQTAVIPGENPLSLFHEYFGHGLYCEQSLIGKRLVDLERKLLKEETEYFDGSQFALEDLQKFRQKNPTFQELDKFRKQNLAQYELFAIWTEFLLSGEHNLRDDFRRKYNSLQREDKVAVDSVINFSRQFGDLATFYAQGLARQTTPQRIRRLLEDIFGDEVVRKSRLILLTGSKKPFSDIDLFASSDSLQAIKNNWMDLVVFNEEDFERRIKLFEVQVTHPILTGEFVAGDKDYLRQKQNQLKEQPITKESIEHNLVRAKENVEYSRHCLNEDREASLSYAKTYLANALALKDGKRILTKEELDISLYSQSETFIELKGGKI